MAINTQTIRIDLNTGRTIPVAFAHQNDTNRQLTFQLYNNGVAFTPSSTTVKFAYKSPIVNGRYSVITGSQMASGTVSGNTVTVTLPAQYTQVSGVGLLTMILTTSGNTLRPVNIKFVCQGSADGDDTILAASDWPEGLYDYMDNWLEENEPTEIANLKSDIGNKSSLNTDTKTNLVSAINEVNGHFLDGIDVAVENWLDEHPEATTTVQDRSLTEIKFSDALKLKTINDYVTPKMYGAVGNGVADDSEALQTMFDEIGGTNKVVIIDAEYKTSVGIDINSICNISCIDRKGAIIGETDDYILKYSFTSDVRRYYLKNIAVVQRGTGDAVLFDNCSALSQFIIDNCRFSTPYTGATGYCLNFTNTLSHSKISNCSFQGNGIYANCYDANVIEKCFFMGEGNGIVYDCNYGVLNNAVRNCTIVNFGGNAIKIINGSQILIDNNQIEYAGSEDQTTTTKGMIHIVGKDRASEHVIIEKNNLGGGTHLDYLIYVSNSTDTIITKNRLVAVNVAEIYVNSNCSRVIIRKDNMGETQALNPRTDRNYHYIVEDHGKGTIGIWKKLYTQGSSVNYLLYLKTEDDLLFFRPFFISSVTNLTIGQLPAGDIPEATSYVIGAGEYTSNGSTIVKELPVIIRWNGEIILKETPPSQMSAFSLPPIKSARYAS